MLCWKGILKSPLLHLSTFFRRTQAEYYSRLQGVRDHDGWENWVLYFLKGIVATAGDASRTASRIIDLRDQHRAKISGAFANATGPLSVLDKMFEVPTITSNKVQEITGQSKPTVLSLISRFEELGILTEITGRKRNRVYEYKPYVDLFRQ